MNSFSAATVIDGEMSGGGRGDRFPSPPSVGSIGSAHSLAPVTLDGVARRNCDRYMRNAAAAAPNDEMKKE